MVPPSSSVVAMVSLPYIWSFVTAQRVAPRASDDHDDHVAATRSSMVLRALGH